ncbi:unnamed protein product [Prorocentrum cordatum]|uniref:Integrase catalytic domain-containing protein n=1 Tax=Prorocentrum cordatum TaxID=2364126 RepID=A0ABN9ULN4_9DINO|nr:unnamed protein product [Polarella glacialis]
MQIGSESIVTTTVYTVAITIDHEPDKLLAYKFGVGLFSKSYKMQDRYVVGPQLVRALGARTRRLAQACPDIDKIDEVTDEGKLTGWQRVFDFLLSKLDLSNVNEMGNSAEKFFNKLQREPGEGFPDWTARWEADERDLLSQLKAVDSSVEEVIAAPLRTWWYLRRSRLSPVARGEITATAGGDYEFGSTYKALCTRYPLEALKEIDGVREKKDRPAGFFGEAEEAEQEDHNFEDRSEIADIVGQLVNLADEEDSTLFEDSELVDDYEDGIYAEFRQLGRNFKDARGLIRKLKFGHLAKDCPERTKDRGKPQPNEMTSFALLELGDLVLLLDDVGGIWAIIDCGATRSLIGVTMAEHLIYDMEEKHNIRFDVVERTRHFTFGDGRRKSSMGTMTGAIFLGDGQEKIEISIMDNEVPLLVGMDVLGPDHTNALIDCGNGYLMLPKISHHVFQCRKMPSGHLAINVTTPTWWQNIPQSLPNIVGITQCNAMEDEAETSAVADEAVLELAPAAGAGGIFGTIFGDQEFEGNDQRNRDISKSADLYEYETPDTASTSTSAQIQSEARGIQGRKRNGCSCMGGQTHPCRLWEAGYPSPNFAQNYRPPRRKNDQPQAGPLESLIPRPASPEVSWLCRSEVIYLMWRRMLSKILKRLANDPSSESFEMLDDSPEKEMAVIDLGGAAFRAGVHNGFDMATKTGVRRLTLWIRQHRPRRIVMSPPCTADCQLQNWNKKTPEDCERLRKKVQKARRIQAGCETIMSVGLQFRGTEIDLEQPQRSHSWGRSEALKRIREQTYETLVSGCAYGLRCPRRGLLLPKVWRICSTDPELQKAIGKRCSNRPGRHDNHEHGEIIGGKVVAATAFYPEALCKVWAKHILRAGGGTTAETSALLATDQDTDDGIFEGIDEDGDLEMEEPQASDEELDEDDPRELSKDGGTLSTKEAQEIEHRLSRLHRNLGHPSVRTMFKIFKNSGASIQVLKMVKKFKCHACDSSVLPKAVKTAAGIDIPEIFEVMGSDGLEWTDPVDDATYLFTLNLDEESGLTQIFNHGDKSQRSGNRSAADLLETWRSWTNHYRAPRLIRCDAEGCRRAELTKSWCSTRGIEMFIAPGEAHWLMGKVERRIQLFKRTLTKFRKQNHDCDIDEAISQVTHAINDLDKVGNHSPFAHAFGTGGHRGSGNPFAIVVDSNGESREQRRLLARQNFIEVEYSAERMVVELNNMERRGATMSDLMEVARRGTFEDLTNESRPRIQNFEPQAIQPSEPPEGKPTVEDNDEELFSQNTFDGNRGGTDFELIDENMTAYFEMVKSELADSQGGRRLTSQILDCFVANQKRKDKIEFHWGKLSPSEKAEFRKAMTKEVANWKQYKGLRRVPVSEIKDPADVIRCRWVLTRKSDGTAKARPVLLGYQTKDIGQEPTASPTASRRARNLLLTVAAANSWAIVKGDVPSAFLQANDLKKDLFVEADEALSAEFGVQPGQVLRVVKPGYGIGEAPRKWWQTVEQDFAKLGLQACDLEPCLWSLRCPETRALLGLIMCHVDDFILCGDRDHPAWRKALKSIKDLYTSGTWEDMDDGIDSIEQCGVTIVKKEKGFFQHQQGYIDKLTEIFPKYPKAKSGDRLTEACDFTVLDWGSRKLKRVARSSLSAEIQEASDAEGEQMMVRLVLCEEGETIVRWVHSHAQLADGMTKASQQAFNVLHSFLKSQRWKIVHDERFLSARATHYELEQISFPPV